jgi:hypothetical protein
MQDFVDQANKNKIKLLNQGKCQLCAAEFQGGIFECIDTYNHVLEIFDFSKSEHHLSKFLSVDAHALQHQEIHGRWSNHFHLTRLDLILDKKQNWNYKKSPLLSKHLNEYKSDRAYEFLIIPKALERGKISSKDFENVKTQDECSDLINQWAAQVYQVWEANHNLISQISEAFLSKMYHE